MLSLLLIFLFFFFFSIRLIQVIWLFSVTLKLWPKNTRSIVLKRFLILGLEQMHWISSNQPVEGLHVWPKDFVIQTNSFYFFLGVFVCPEMISSVTFSQRMREGWRCILAFACQKCCSGFCCTETRFKMRVRALSSRFNLNVKASLVQHVATLTPSKLIFLLNPSKFTQFFSFKSCVSGVPLSRTARNVGQAESRRVYWSLGLI